MTSDTNQLLLEVTALAREAGRAILEVYASSFSVQEKEDRSPLTEADLRSEKLILAGLRSIAPEIPVLSEESVQLPYSTRKHWSRLWIVDQLDGEDRVLQALRRVAEVAVHPGEDQMRTRLQHRPAVVDGPGPDPVDPVDRRGDVALPHPHVGLAQPGAHDQLVRADRRGGHQSVRPEHLDRHHARCGGAQPDGLGLAHRRSGHQ